ncbi:MAG TPA: mechanosensitive ion channel family protein [Candidatus Krumholzibacteriaceae bacterium]|nr:mechanosensitive ion channel family protein [Candidatus Krumholzibacteriaceae bacterium]
MDFADIVSWINDNLGISQTIQFKIFSSIALIILIWVIRGITLRIAFKRVGEIRGRYQWRKMSAYISVFVAVLLVGRIWIHGLQTLVTFIGIISAGLVLALKDPIVNFAAWIFIIWRRPFEPGDRIQIAGSSGDVVDIRVFQFSLIEVGNWVDADQSTGRIIHVPNGKIFTEALANYSAGLEYIWNEIPVLITFESDWKKAKKILLEIAGKHAEHLANTARSQLNRMKGRFLIHYEKLTPTVYTSVKNSGVILTIRYMCDPRARRGSEQEIWEDILNRFGENEDIDFAYPTQRIYSEYFDRKPGKPSSPGE